MFTNHDEETRMFAWLDPYICVRDFFIPLHPEAVDILHLVPLNDPPPTKAVVPVLPIRLGSLLTRQKNKFILITPKVALTLNTA